MTGEPAWRGVFTSTATVVLEAIEQGRTLADGIAHAQHMGIAEADPSYDGDGWDSAVKLCALANVMLDGNLRPDDVSRVGLRALDDGEIRRACVEGYAGDALRGGCLSRPPVHHITRPRSDHHGLWHDGRFYRYREVGRAPGRCVACAELSTALTA